MLGTVSDIKDSRRFHILFTCAWKCFQRIWKLFLMIFQTWILSPPNHPGSQVEVICKAILLEVQEVLKYREVLILCCLLSFSAG